MKNTVLDRLENIDLMDFNNSGLLKISRIARIVQQRSGKRVILSAKHSLTDLVDNVLALDDGELNEYLCEVLYEQVIFEAEKSQESHAYNNDLQYAVA
ncbi:MAG: hypothetical protein KTR16_08415 [Acidiferrobacterales bacterium]|nr:hypothetical protein [Acidiferrobacterales bacterium]